MYNFTYEALAGRVVFGSGSLNQLPVEIERLGATKALLIVTGSAHAHLPQILEKLGAKHAGTIPEVAQHVPIEAAQAARELANERGADCIVTLGGGSATGLGKAIALESALPVIAVPTTFSGSEMTPIYGLTANGRKQTGRDPKVLPRTVIYDPELVYTMPVALAATSGINALAHCVEALYAENANPIINLIAAEGAKALADGLPRIVNSYDDRDQKEGYYYGLYGAYLAGVSLGATGTALHHKVCHVLGGSFNLPHAATHSVILPYAVAYNAESAPAAMLQLRRALNTSDVVEALFRLVATLDVPTSLKEIGMPEDGLNRAAQLITEKPFYNPAPVTYAAIRKMLEAAYQGKGKLD
jgi:maleylacetate reductase